MGVLDRFEKGIERAVNGAFAKAFRSEVQPVEIASALRREVDDKAAIVARDRTIVPNTFVVELGHADHERLGQWTDALGEELGAVINDHARQQRYSFVGPVQVAFEEAADLDTGVFRVRSQTVRRDGHAYQPSAAAPGPSSAPASAQSSGQSSGQAAAGPAAQPAAGPAAPSPAQPPGVPPVAAPQWSPSAEANAPTQAAPSAPPQSAAAAHAAVPPSIDVDGSRYEITSAVTVIGRGTDAHIVLDDPGASRRHAEVHILDGKARVIDLGSTNGTFVDGDRVPVGTLREGSTITIGRTRMTFHIGGLATWQPEGGQPDYGQGSPGYSDERGVSDQRGQGQW